MADSTITVKNERDLPSITAEGNTTQRQGSAMTEIMRQDQAPTASIGLPGGRSKCKGGSGCNFWTTNHLTKHPL